MKLLTALSTLFTILISPVAISADTTIEMLNKLEKETMVFSQKIVTIRRLKPLLLRFCEFGLFQKMLKIRRE